MLRAAITPHPRRVLLLTNAQMNQMDFERQLAQAAKINRRDGV